MGVYEDIEKKVNELKEKGVELFPNPSCFKRTKTSKEIADNFSKLENKEENIAGRITSIRGHGKASFVDVADFFGKIQVMVRFDDIGEQNYEIFKELDVGDFIGVEGVVIKTKTEEISIRAKKITILAKVLRPLPSKWYGLKDLELRYRRRYLDLLMNPEIKEKLIKKSMIVKSIREFMDSNGFIEVQTPILQSIYGGASAEPFITHHNALNADFYLRISTEMYLKRLMVSGFEKIYEIGPVFRNEGIDTSHLQEIPNHFEFYWAYQNYEGLMEFTEKMLVYVLNKVLGTTKVKYQDLVLDFTPPIKRVKFKDLLLEHTGLDIDKCNTYEKLVAEIKAKKIKDIDLKKIKHYGALIDEFYKKTCRPQIIQPIFLTHYPVEMIPLAKRNEKDKSKINTFQLVANGIEFVKAYDELNDPVDQRKRLEEQQKFLEMGDKEAHPLDNDFIEAMEYGMPPMAGFGLGIDRFAFLLLDFENIRGSLWFPTLRPEK